MNNISDHWGISFDTLEAFVPDDALPWDPVLGLGTPKWSAWESYFLNPSSSNTITPSPTPSPSSSTTNTSDSTCPAEKKWLYVVLFFCGGIVGSILCWVIISCRLYSKRRMDGLNTALLEDAQSSNIRSSHNILQLAKRFFYNSENLKAFTTI